MPSVQINTTNEITYRNLNYTLLIQAHSVKFTENEIRTTFEKYGKIRRLKPTLNGKQAQLTYGSLSEAAAAVQGVHDKPPLKLQVDYYKKNNDFVSRYEYTHCQISSVDPIERSYRVRRVKDASNYKKFHEMLQEASNKCSETIDVDKLVIDDIYSVMYGGVWKRGKILSTNPIEIDLIDDGKTLKPPVKITSYKKLGKLADNSPFSKLLKIKASSGGEKKSLHTGSYVEIRMIGQHDNIIHVVRKSDEVLKNNINNKKSSPCPAAIKIDKTSIQKNDVKIAKKVDIKIPCDEKNIEQVKKNNTENTSDEKKINIEIKKEHENNIDLVVINDNNDDMVVQEDDNEIDNIDVIDVESSYNFENESSEPTSILQCDICIFDSLVAESSNEVSISDQIDSTTATAVFQYNGKETFQLLDKLKDHCNKVVQNYDSYKPSINDYICFKQPGHTNWFRGIVLSVGILIKVASLDQGIETTAHKIIPVPDMFKKLPALAVKLKTHDKFPYSIGDLVNLFICDIDKESKTVIAKFTQIKNNSGVQITQWTPWLNDGKSGAEKIPTARIVPLNVPSVESVIPIVVQTINSTIVEKENIEKKSSSIGTENPAPRNKIKNVTIKDFNLKNNSRVVVQSYVGPSVIYVTSMELDDISQKKYLNQKICCAAETSDLINNPNVGDYVLACYNDSYYRAKILSIRDEKIVADFIDFGLIEIIKPDNMKKIPESLMNHPSLMKQVTLKNVDNQTPTNEAANYIKTLFATEEILICSFDGNQQDKVELKTLDNKSVNNEINKLLKKCNTKDIKDPIIPNPKPQLRLNIIKREEIISIDAKKDANKIKSSKTSKTIEKKSKSEVTKTKSSEEKKLSRESSSSSSSSSSSKRKLPSEISSSTKSPSSTSKEKKIKLAESSLETSKKCESVDDKHKSSSKTSKKKSLELKKSVITPIKSHKSRKECKHCGKSNHETYECFHKKDSERRSHEHQDSRRRFEYHHDLRLPDLSRYPNYHDTNNDLRNYEQAQRLHFDRLLPVCPHENCFSKTSKYDPRNGPVKYCYQDCPFRSPFF